ncbi:hypothetical protein E2C01_035212 [Portunus trituberculatus]|uniref:Uncharacterized protein n=1 Tax=Portunus trituberculatus TaxID=210409 RepID=A0A5B7F541_PORTR|nr:hypothetical protein [Portunus trituberculatus]
MKLLEGAQRLRICKESNEIRPLRVSAEKHTGAAPHRPPPGSTVRRIEYSSQQTPLLFTKLEPPEAAE